MSNATDYADSLAAQIQEDCDNSTPFGIAEETYGDYEQGDELTAYDWLESALDIQYLVSSDRQYHSARVLIAFGGPNAWVDTRTGNLEVSWWSAPEYRELPAAFIDALDEALSEFWESR